MDSLSKDFYVFDTVLNWFIGFILLFVPNFFQSIVLEFVFFPNLFLQIIGLGFIFYAISQNYFYKKPKLRNFLIFSIFLALSTITVLTYTLVVVKPPLKFFWLNIFWMLDLYMLVLVYIFYLELK